MRELTGFQRDCLYVISGIDAPKGLDIKAELDEYYVEDINHGRLYPNLDEIADRGLIMIDKKDGRTNKYKITPHGQRKLRRRYQWEQDHLDDQ